MKQLLFGLLAFALVLGAGCKKEVSDLPKSSLNDNKKEVAPAKLKPDVQGVVDDSGGPGVPSDGGSQGSDNEGFKMGTINNLIYPTGYNECHPWTMQYPNGWPLVHEAHGTCCGGVKWVSGEYYQAYPPK